MIYGEYHIMVELGRPLSTYDDHQDDSYRYELSRNLILYQIDRYVYH